MSFVNFATVVTFATFATRATVRSLGTVLRSRGARCHRKMPRFAECRAGRGPRLYLLITHISYAFHYPHRYIYMLYYTYI